MGWHERRWWLGGSGHGSVICTIAAGESGAAAAGE